MVRVTNTEGVENVAYEGLALNDLFHCIPLSYNAERYSFTDIKRDQLGEFASLCPSGRTDLLRRRVCFTISESQRDSCENRN